MHIIEVTSSARQYDDDFDKNRGGATVILHDQWNSTYEVEIKELMIDTKDHSIELKGRWGDYSASLRKQLLSCFHERSLAHDRVYHCFIEL